MSTTIRLSSSTDLSGPAWFSLALVVTLAIASLAYRANLIPGGLSQVMVAGAEADAVASAGAIGMVAAFPVSP